MHSVSDKCIEFLPVNKMHCKYVILLIIYIQETIILLRHRCSVWHIKAQRHKSVNCWVLENINMLFSILQGLYLRSLERDRALGNYTSYFMFSSCNAIIFLVSAHLQWNVLEYYLKWVDWSQTYKHTRCFFILSVLFSSFCTLGHNWLCTCVEIIGLPSSLTAVKYGLDSYLIETEATVMYSYH